MTYTETEDGRSKPGSYSENWKFFGSLDRKYDLYRWLFQGDTAHIFGTETRGSKLHVEFADHDMDPALQFKANPTREPRSLYSAMEVFDIERVRDKILGTYSRLQHEKYRIGAPPGPDHTDRSGVIACENDATSKLIYARRTQ